MKHQHMLNRFAECIIFVFFGGGGGVGEGCSLIAEELANVLSRLRPFFQLKCFQEVRRSIGDLETARGSIFSMSMSQNMSLDFCVQKSLNIKWNLVMLMPNTRLRGCNF